MQEDNPMLRRGVGRQPGAGHPGGAGLPGNRTPGRVPDAGAKDSETGRPSFRRLGGQVHSW